MLHDLISPCCPIRQCRRPLPCNPCGPQHSYILGMERPIPQNKSYLVWTMESDAQVRPCTVTCSTCQLALAMCGRLVPVQAWSNTVHRCLRNKAPLYLVDCQSQTSLVVSDSVLHVVACWPYRAIDVAHSAVRPSQSPDPLSGTCFQASSETLTALSPHSSSSCRHSSSTSISVSSALEVYTFVCYINPHFTYLLTLTTAFWPPHSLA